MPHSHNQFRAFCLALATARSALLAILLVWLPDLIHFTRGQWTQERASELLRSLLVAVLMILFNFIQRFREKQPARRRWRRRGDHNSSEG